MVEAGGAVGIDGAGGEGIVTGIDAGGEGGGEAVEVAVSGGGWVTFGWILECVSFLFCFFCISSVPRVPTVFAAGGKRVSKTARESMRRRMRSNYERNVVLAAAEGLGPVTHGPRYAA